MSVVLQRNQAGFTLLEALITIVIISIGLLGLLGLQTVSVVDTQTSAARTQASIAADNIADRIRANSQGVVENDYANISNPAAGTSPTACTGGTICTPAQMATYDGWAWDTALKNQLPGGKGYVRCTTAGTGTSCLVYTITVGWTERSRDTQGTAAAAAQTSGGCGSITALSGYRCFQTQVQP